MRIRPLGIKPLIGIAAASIVAGASILTVGASSHNDAPLIAEDPLANNTDVYAFVSTEEGRSDNVTLIANYIPNQEPGNGPTHYRFSNGVLYEIMVDVDGDAKEDLTYQFQFENNIANGNTFLYSTLPIKVPSNPEDPTAQYENLNIQQSYTLTEVIGDRRGKGTKHRDVLMEDARVAPANVGPRSTPDYESLAEAAVHSFKFDIEASKSDEDEDSDGETSSGYGASDHEIGPGRVFAGPRDEGFYIDLMGFFDLLNLRDENTAVDTFSGLNVHSIALEIPKERLAIAGDTDGVIGVWASASRQRTRVLGKDGKDAENRGRFVQVSRLGNLLVNELAMPLKAKDLFNATEPKDDHKNIVDFVVNPGNSQGPGAVVPLLNSVTGCTPENARVDLQLALLTGIPDGVLPGFPGNQDTQQAHGPALADMLRLNYNVPPAGTADPLTIFKGDIAGFPNGRRVGDDVTDIFARAGAGAVLHLLGAINCPISLEITDSVQTNDVPYLDKFPYLGTPHQAYSHEHTHATGSMMVMSTGFGLLATGLVLGSVFVFRRRRSTLFD